MFWLSMVNIRFDQLIGKVEVIQNAAKQLVDLAQAHFSRRNQ